MTVAAQVDYRSLVAAEIRAWAARRGIKQVELAARLGESESWVSRRLKGGRMIEVNDLARIASVLGVSVQDLLPRLDSNQQPSGYSDGDDTPVELYPSADFLAADDVDDLMPVAA